MTSRRDAEERVAFIPARGGSKRIPRKNARVMVGKPLVQWAIDAALETGVFRHVVVSTDDPEIADIAQAGGAQVPCLRPAHLALDNTSSLDVVLHELGAFPDCSLGVLIQPTSPLVLAADIAGAVRLLEARRARSVVSVCEAPVSPATLFSLVDDATHEMRPVRRPMPGDPREQKQRWVSLNGALYAFRPNWLRNSRTFIDDATLAYVMPTNRSVDVDIESDWMLAESLLRLRQGRP